MAYRSQTLFALAGLVTALWLTGCTRGPAHCSVCDRHECKAMAFRVTMSMGRKVETCCVRCGMHFLAANSAARDAEATDFSTGHWIDATKAVYVVGSDAPGCAMAETRRDAQGCCMMKDYDRCLPSTLAFAAREAAAGFQRQHGGTIQTWQELLKH